MTTRILTDKDSFHAPQFAVVGQYGVFGDFIMHAAMLAEECPNMSSKMEVPVIEMGLNGLIVEMIPNDDSVRTYIDIVAYIDFDESEKLGISTFLEYLKYQVKRAKFKICPHVDLEMTSFSCIGLVHECYSRAMIPLVNLSTLPPVQKTFIERVFPTLGDAANRVAFGLVGIGPWKLLLPGYAFHSLARGDQEVRTTPFEVNSLDDAQYH